MDNEKKKELIALIEYMIHHNEHHNDELKELGDSIKDISQDAYQKVLNAIESFDEGNRSLASALEELEK